MFLTVKEFDKQMMEQKIGINRGVLTFKMAGVDISVKNNLSLRTFRKHGTRCACCGLEAEGYMLDKQVHHKSSQKKRKTVARLVLFGYRSNGTKVEMTCDHVIPKARGGAKTSITNLQTLCYDCNHTKADMLPSEQIFGQRKWWTKFSTKRFENEDVL